MILLNGSKSRLLFTLIKCNIQQHWQTQGDTRDSLILLGPIFFNLVQLVEKYGQNNRLAHPPLGLAPPSVGEILDPPLNNKVEDQFQGEKIVTSEV